MRMLILFLSLHCAYLSISQPFNLQFGDSGDDFIYKVLPADSNQFFLLGSVFKDNGRQAWLMKVDSAGRLVWSHAYGFQGPDNWEAGLTLLKLSDGHMLIAADAGEGHFSRDGLSALIKVDRYGNQIWKHYYDSIGGIKDIQPDGTGFIAVGSNSRDAAILHIDSAGNELRRGYFKFNDVSRLHRVFPTGNDQYILVGRATALGHNYRDAFIGKVNAQHEFIWYKTFETRNADFSYYGTIDLFSAPMNVYMDSAHRIWIADNYEDQIGLFEFDTSGNQLDLQVFGHPRKAQWPTSILHTSDAGWLISGLSEPDSSFALKLNTSGKQEWIRYYGNANHESYAFATGETNGNYVLAGYRKGKADTATTNGWLLGIEKDGNPFPYTVHLSVHYDKVGNCEYSTDDFPLPGWFITAIDSHRVTHLVTDAQGNAVYKTDAYETRFDYMPQNTKHVDLCINTDWAYMTSQNPEITKRNVVHRQSNCAEIEVGLTQPDLFACDTSSFWITLTNRGTKPAAESLLRFEYDTTLELIEISSSYVADAEGILINTSPIAALGGVYRIFGKVALSCDAQLGSAHRMAARLLSENCEPVFDGPKYSIAGSCEGEKIRFEMANAGGGGSKSKTWYNLYVNDLPLIDSQAVILPEGGASLILEYPADGRTWRMELLPDPQEPNQRFRVATVEGCGRLNTGLYNVGFTNGFSSGPADINLSEVFAVHSAGLPDVVTEAMPGMLEQNIILRAEPLEYTARVRNNTGKIVDKVILEISLTEGLNLTSFHVLSSNVGVELQIVDNTTLQATMENIHLSPGDDAMMRFRVEPFDSVMASQFGTELRVEARVFMDSVGPIDLLPGFHEFVFDNPAQYAGYADYDPNMLFYGGRGGDLPGAIGRDENGDLFIAASSDSYTKRFNNLPVVIKTDSNGKVIWQKAIKIEDQEFYVPSIIPTGNGECLLVGSNGVLVQLDAFGNMIWYTRLDPVPEIGDVYVYGGFKSTDGSLIIHGTVKGEVTSPIVLKVDFAGNVIWKSFPISGPRLTPFNGVNLNNGRFGFWGYRSNSNSYQPVLLVLDEFGEYVWGGSYSFSGYGYQYGAGFAATPDQGLLLLGYGDTDTLSSNSLVPKLIKIDSLGVKLWQKDLWVGDGLRVQPHTIQPADGGGYLIGGEISGHLPDKRFDMFLCKVNEEAQIEWYRYYGNINDENISEIVISSQDEIWLLARNTIRTRHDKVQTMLLKTNGDGLTGIQSVESFDTDSDQIVLLFPNPATEKLNVLLSPGNGSLVHWMVCDNSGRAISTGMANSMNPFQIQTDDLRPGMYMITFPGSGFPSRKFIIAR